MVNYSGLPLEQKKVKETVDELEVVVDEVDREIEKIDWIFTESCLTRQQSGDHFIELMQAVTRKPKDTNMISHIPIPRRPQNKNETLMDVFDAQWIDKELTKLDKPLSTFNDDLTFSFNKLNDRKTNKSEVTTPVNELTALKVRLDYWVNRLLQRDIKAQELKNILTAYQDNKVAIKERMKVLNVSELHLPYHLMPNKRSLSNPGYIPYIKNTKQDLEKFLTFKPVVDHLIWKSITTQDFTHPLLKGLFPNCKSSKTLVCCLKTVSDYWEDIHESNQLALLDIITKNRKNLSEKDKQEIEDLLTIIKTVY